MKTEYIVGVIVVLGIGGLLLYKFKFAKKDEPKKDDKKQIDPEPSPNPVPQKKVVQKKTATFPLKKGSRNSEVRRLQDFLVSKGYIKNSDVVAGGNLFGDKTLAALKAYNGKSIVESVEVLNKITGTSTNSSSTTQKNEVVDNRGIVDRAIDGWKSLFENRTESSITQGYKGGV